jgi:hypothetical protein
MLARNSVSNEDRWRFGVLQLLDDYESVRRHDGADAEAMMFMEVPGSTGDSGLDALDAELAVRGTAADLYVVGGRLMPAAHGIHAR